MAIISVVVLKPRPGGHGQTLEMMSTIKRLVEKAGGTFRASIQVIGSASGTIGGISEYSGWDGLAKFRSDPEFRQFLDRARGNANPPYDVIDSAVYEDVPVK